MDEVRLLLRRLDKEARRKFGEHYRVWNEPYPSPGGYISSHPKHQTDYIVTLNFLESILENGIGDLEGFEMRLEQLKKERALLWEETKRIDSDITRLERMRNFLRSIKI